MPGRGLKMSVAQYLFFDNPHWEKLTDDELENVWSGFSDDVIEELEDERIYLLQAPFIASFTNSLGVAGLGYHY